MAKLRMPSSEQMPSASRERRARGAHFNEVGALGLRHTGGFVREEYLLQLQGPNGMKMIREMMDNDPVIGGFLFAVEQAIRQVDWKVIPAIAKPVEPKPRALVDPLTNLPFKEPTSPVPPMDPTQKPAVKKFMENGTGGSGWREALKYANYLDSCRLDMGQTWGEVMTEALTFLPFGWSALEVTYKVRRGWNDDPDLCSRYEDGLVSWKRMSLRAQESLRRWVYDEVSKDKLLAMQQFTFEKGMVDIPMNRLIHFRTKSFKDNPEGRSILRNAYRPWYLKKRIEEAEGIGIERDMAGLPVLTAPENLDLWNAADPIAVATREAAERIVRNIRIDEQMGVLLPFGWELTLLTSAGKKMINTTDVINRYDQRIAMTVLADFMLLGHTNRLGSFALAKSKTGLFAMSLVGYLNVLRDAFNTHELPRLWRLNGFPMEMMPRLDYTPVDTPSLKDLASYITALSGAMVDFSLPELQRYLLQSAGIPADVTDLAGRGGTGDDLDSDGTPDDEEEADGQPSTAGRPAGRPTGRPTNRGVYTGRSAAATARSRRAA